uniref:Uncharacterized protein n=1 Tax=Romanomermis culicivorax TaxID=13658 RepID=A0A915JKY6_ROMCU
MNLPVWADQRQVAEKSRVRRAESAGAGTRPNDTSPACPESPTLVWMPRAAEIALSVPARRCRRAGRTAKSTG